MPVSFVETMRGWMRGPSGPEFPVSFELRAVHLGGGRCEVRGLVSVPPLARETPAHGTLVLSLRELAYHLEFTAADGRHLVLDAMKHPSPFALLRTMTRMPATIRDEAGDLVASGHMVFALSDLPAFLASWLPVRTLAHRQLDARRRQLERLALSGGAGSR